MSLTSPRLTALFMVLALVALTVVSCTQPTSPTSPSSLTGSLAVQPAVTEYWVTLFDETGDPTVPAPPPPPGSGPVPWPPGPPPMALPGISMPTPPSTHTRMKIKIDPESVPHSGQPVPLFACRDLRHTWYYNQHLDAETGVPVTIGERENFFDGRFSSKNTDSLRLVAHQPVILHTRWCSAFPGPHYTQTRFKGRDDEGQPVVISGPWVRLLTPQ